MNEEEDPLGQRTTGRRSRHRQERAENRRRHDDDGDNDQLSESSQESVAAPSDAPIRRPRAEIESQIDAAIEARRKQQQVFDTHNPEEGEPDVLGDYEYLDHTADVQLHSWGETLEQALENLVLAMLGYMTRLSRINLVEEQQVTVQAHDATSLVFVFLQEWLSLFHETGFVARQVEVTKLNREDFTIAASGSGETFDAARHTQGTEVKAVTYSNLQVIESSDGDRCDIWVIVDI